MNNRNRAIVTSFADLFYNQRKVREAFEGFVAENYIQHNPNIADGREAAIVALTPLFSRTDMQFKIRRILVDGEHAAIHLHALSPDMPRGTSVVDMFRLEGGRIVEHWDVLQPVPPDSKNPHPMF
jgi:predicted SnoaL-like aldol condensation-catalyzing enzyme